jgi:hypothetical protein
MTRKKIESEGFIFDIDESLLKYDQNGLWFDLVKVDSARVKLEITGTNKEHFSNWEVHHRSIKRGNLLDYKYVRFSCGTFYFKAFRTQDSDGDYSKTKFVINGTGEVFMNTLQDLIS